MKFKAKNGKIYNDWIGMTLANTRQLFTKKEKEDELMGFEEFNEDIYEDDGSKDDEDDGSSNIPDTLAIHKFPDHDAIIVSDISHDESCPSMAFNIVSNKDDPKEIIDNVLSDRRKLKKRLFGEMSPTEQEAYQKEVTETQKNLAIIDNIVIDEQDLDILDEEVGPDSPPEKL